MDRFLLPLLLTSSLAAGQEVAPSSEDENLAEGHESFIRVGVFEKVANPDAEAFAELQDLLERSANEPFAYRDFDRLVELTEILKNPGKLEDPAAVQIDDQLARPQHERWDVLFEGAGSFKVPADEPTQEQPTGSSSQSQIRFETDGYE